MSYLIFCTFEVGGLPFKMAEILNRFGTETYYVYLGKEETGHDSTQFHYGSRFEKWDLSPLFFDIRDQPLKVVSALKEIKAKYDISCSLATGHSVHYLYDAGIAYKYWSYGGDLDYQCFVRRVLLNNLTRGNLRLNLYRLFVERTHIRKSIYYSTAVMVAPYQLEALNKVCPNKKLFFLPHFMKVVDYQELVKQKTESERLMWKRMGTDKYFFSSTRHLWDHQAKYVPDIKGNEVILYAYKKYLEESRDYDSRLVLVRKGADVASTEKLSMKLSIEKQTLWVDEMKRKDLDKYYQAAKMCFGQFGSRVITNSILEPLANGSVGVSFWGENSTAIPFYKDYPPILNSRDPRKISAFMIELSKNQPSHEDLSYKSWLWVKNNCSEEVFVRAFRGLVTES